MAIVVYPVGVSELKHADGRERVWLCLRNEANLWARMISVRITAITDRYVDRPKLGILCKNSGLAQSLVGN